MNDNDDGDEAAELLSATRHHLRIDEYKDVASNSACSVCFGRQRWLLVLVPLLLAASLTVVLWPEVSFDSFVRSYPSFSLNARDSKLASESSFASSSTKTWWQLCEADHIGAQRRFRGRNGTIDATIADRMLRFDGSTTAYYSSDVWPSLSVPFTVNAARDIVLKEIAAHFRLFIFAMRVEADTHLVYFNYYVEFTDGNHLVLADFDGELAYLAQWWTHESPDVQLECAHRYSNDVSDPEEVTAVFFQRAQSKSHMLCHYALTPKFSRKVPLYTVIRFARRSPGASLVHPIDATMKGTLWKERWRVVPDMAPIDLKWCQITMPSVYISSFVKPIFGGDARASAERLLNFIQWHRIIGVDHFYVFDRFGGIIQASIDLVKEWKVTYANSTHASEWTTQFHDLYEYINAGVVTWIPSPCTQSHLAHNPYSCGAYVDHVATAWSSLYMSRHHAQWILQSDIDEYVFLLPPLVKMTPNQGRPQSAVDLSIMPVKPDVVMAEAQKAVSSGIYYPRTCGNSLHCPSPLHDFLQPLSRYPVIGYVVWNAIMNDDQRVSDDFNARSIARMRTTAAVDVEAVLGRRHWNLDRHIYRKSIWYERGDKYFCQPRLTDGYGTHSGGPVSGFSSLFMLPYHGIYAAHNRNEYALDFDKEQLLLDLSVPTIIDTVPAPALDL